MDKRVIKTKQNISDALLYLIRQKASNKITVSEIAEKANIERKTFYLHYSCIEDVYLDIEKHISDELEAEANKYINASNYQFKNIYYNLNTVINNNIDFFKSIVINDSYSFLLHSFEKVLSKVIMKIGKEKCHIKSKNLKYYSNFYASGIVKLYSDWLKGDTDLTMDELTSILTRVSFMDVDSLVKSASS